MKQQRAEATPSVPPEVMGLADYFGYLSVRWADEKEYEDFEDYLKAFGSRLPKGSTLHKMTSRPFAAEFTLPGGSRSFFRVRRGNVEYGSCAPAQPAPAAKKGGARQPAITEEDARKEVRFLRDWSKGKRIERRGGDWWGCGRWATRIYKPVLEALVDYKLAEVRGNELALL